MGRCIAPCPTHFERNNSMARPAEMMKWIKAHTVSQVAAERMTPDELWGKYVTGVFADVQKEDYSTAYQNVIDRLREEDGQ